MIIEGKDVEAKGMVKNTRQKGQIQPAGVDLSVESIWRFDRMGVIDEDNSKRKIPECHQIKWKEDGSIELEPGAYKIIFNEIVSIPKDAAAIARPRS
ncbi:MAG: deoxyuridine 5'-triphosphate nucleotidohydrolase, partial [Candidatus Micrarchaeota archaeon]